MSNPTGTTPRQRGENPRARGSSPRQQGTNPRAQDPPQPITRRDIQRLEDKIDQVIKLLGAERRAMNGPRRTDDGHLFLPGTGILDTDRQRSPEVLAAIARDEQERV